MNGLTTQRPSVVVEAMPRDSNNDSNDNNNNKRQRRVRFEEDSETRQVKRRVRESPLPKASLLTPDEKACYWMQHADHRATLHDVMALVHDCHHGATTAATTPPTSSSCEEEEEEDPNKVPFAQYAEALAITFTLCDTPQHLPKDDHSSSSSSSPSWNIRTSNSVAQLALWASHHTSTRGVESKILPGLLQERQLRRRRAIQGVLQAQQRFQRQGRNDDNRHDDDDDRAAHSLSCLSISLTHSAAQFAAALAIVDGRQALLEYAAMAQQQQQASSNHNNSKDEIGASLSRVSSTKASATHVLLHQTRAPPPPSSNNKRRKLQQPSLSAAAASPSVVVTTV